jgi:hypothetical protein
MPLINKSAGKRLYHKIADKWKVPRRMPRGFMADLEKLVETKLSTEANRRGCIKRGQQEFNFANFPK